MRQELQEEGRSRRAGAGQEQEDDRQVEREMKCGRGGGHRAGAQEDGDGDEGQDECHGDYSSQGGSVSASVGWSEYEIVSKFLFNNFHAKIFEFVLIWSFCCS